nr:hypothetical protein [Tanacetum cinerariifolium]
MQTTHDAEEPAIMPYDSLLPRVQSLGSVEGSLTLNELTVLCTKFSKRVEDLQFDLQQTKLTYGAAYTKLILRAKKLEHKIKTSQHRRRERVVLFDDEEDLEDPSKQGMKITETDENPSISLVQDKGTSLIQEVYEIYERTSANTKILLYQEEPTELVRSAKKRKDKRKDIMKEDKSIQKKSKKQLEQERLGHEEAIRLQEQIFEEERQRIARDGKIAKQLQKAIAEADSAYDIDWNDPAILRYHALQNRSFSVAEQTVGGSRKKTVAKKRIDAKLDEESVKRQKLKDVTEEKATAEYKKEKEELRLSLKIIHNDESEVNYYPLSRKFPIERFQDHPLEGHDLLLWGDLRMIFDPDENDELWMNQLDWKLLRWKLHENCGVHTLFMDADCDPEEEIRLIEKLLYDNSSPRPPEEINSKNSDVVIESFSPSPIPVEDSDPFIEVIELFLTSDGSILPGIDSDYSDSKGDNLFPERLLHDAPPLPDILDSSYVV